MFPVRYFCNEYFARRYWPKTGAALQMGELTLTTARGRNVADRVALVGQSRVRSIERGRMGGGRG